MQAVRTKASSQPTGRPPIMGQRYLVSSGHNLASLAGLRMLEKGGNAIDAGVATGLAINVVQGDKTNLGGVCPIIMYLAKTREVLTISGLGWWPKAASIEWFTSRGYTEYPVGVLNSVVPSAVDGWITALRKYGRLSLAEVAAPAIELAERGFPVDIHLPPKIAKSHKMMEALPTLRAVWMPNGRVPEAGEVLVQKDLASTLKRLVEAEQGAAHLGRDAGLQAARDRFYTGDIAREIVEYCQAEGGFLTMEDMAEFSVGLEAPVKTNYRGYDVYACDSWCQGPMVPATLNLLEHYNLGAYEHNSVEHLHILTEALKLAFSDRHHFYGDQRFVKVPMDGLLSKPYAAERHQLIDMARAWPEMPPPGDPWAHSASRPLTAAAGPGASPLQAPYTPDTSYLCVVDEEGNAFSCTPSDGFTNTPIVPGLGIIISSRGSQSWLDPSHPASLAPGKRPRLTPSPGLVMKDGELYMPYGTPGGDVQPQAMVQFLSNMIDFGMNPQQAVEAPRIASASHPDSFDPHPYEPGLLRVEASIDPEVLAGLEAKGHILERWPSVHDPGRIPGSVCGILVDKEHGVLSGAADPRDMAYAIGW